MTNPINGYSGANYEATAPQVNNDSLGQRDFLRLMVAQIKNQDPMQPMTNGDFLGQMAQFSANDGINNMQNSLAQLTSSLQSNQALQASALVGRKVMVNSNKLNLPAEGEVKAAVNLPSGVSQLTASVYNEAGELVRSIPLGQPTPGLKEFSWDGMNQKGERAAAGSYTFKVTGQYNGQDVALKPLVTANVDSVSLSNQNEGVKLNLAGIGTVLLSDVQQITN